MSKAEAPANIPDGVRHLYGTLFVANFNLIRTPTDGESFQNPRILTESGQSDLLDKKASTELRESIRNNTLLNPLVCRWAKDKSGTTYPQVVGGDRRYRALDFLIRKKEIVKDPRSAKLTDKGEWEYTTCSAHEAYGEVPCQIFSCNNDLDALALAWAENKSRINLTEGHEVAEVIKLRTAGASDEKILEILQQDSKWLKDTDALLFNLDNETLSDLLEGRIDRDSAAELTSIADEDVRNQVRIKSNEVSAELCSKRIKRLQRQIEETLNAKEIAEGDEADAAFNKDEGRLASAKEEIGEADKKAKRIIKERDNTKPITTKSEVKKARAEVTGESDRKIRTLRTEKIKEGLDYIDDLIGRNGKCAEGTFEIPVEKLKLVRAVLNNNILANEPDFAATLRRHAKKD